MKETSGYFKVVVVVWLISFSIYDLKHLSTKCSVFGNWIPHDSSIQKYLYIEYFFACKNLSKSKELIEIKKNATMKVYNLSHPIERSRTLMSRQSCWNNLPPHPSWDYYIPGPHPSIILFLISKPHVTMRHISRWSVSYFLFF